MASAPIEGFELDGSAAVVFVELGRKSDIEGADWERFIAGTPPEGFVGGDAIREPHFDVLFVVADALERALVDQIAGAELDSGVTLAHRLQASKMGESFEADFIEADFSIETQGRLEFVRLKSLARDVVEVGTEGIEFIGSKADAGGHGVAAMADKQMVALAQGGREVKTGDTAPGTAPFNAVTADNDCGAIKLLEHA